MNVNDEWKYKIFDCSYGRCMQLKFLFFCLFTVNCSIYFTLFLPFLGCLRFIYLFLFFFLKNATVRNLIKKMQLIFLILSKYSNGTHQTNSKNNEISFFLSQTMQKICKWKYRVTAAVAARHMTLPRYITEWIALNADMPIH